MSYLERRNDFRARIAELEAENAKLKGDEDRVIAVWKDKKWRDAEDRIAELEAENTRTAMFLREIEEHRDNLEAERDRLKAALVSICDSDGQFETVNGIARAALSDPSGETQ